MYQPETITQKQLNVAGKYPVYGANGVMGWYDRYNHEDSQLIIGCRGACGSIHITPPQSWITGNSMVIKPDLKRLDLRFLSYFFHESADLPSVITGAAQPQLTQASLKPIIVPLPPLSEQKRIVTVLDEAFAILDRVRASAELNLNDSVELFSTWLTSIFHNHPSSWRTEKLHSLCRQITVGHVGPMAERYVEEGIPFLRSQNIRPFELSLTDVKRIDEKFHRELAKSSLAPGDVAIVRTGYPGTAAVIPESLPVSNCADLVIVRLKEMISAEFLVLFLNSTFGKEMVAEKAVGAAQKHFNVGAAKQVDFPFPDFAQQQLIALQARKLRAHIRELKESYRAKLADIATLRQSLLQAAFSGRLT